MVALAMFISLYQAIVLLLDDILCLASSINPWDSFKKTDRIRKKIFGDRTILNGISVVTQNDVLYIWPRIQYLVKTHQCFMFFLYCIIVSEMFYSVEWTDLTNDLSN